jgi:acyl carrier protein
MENLRSEIAAIISEVAEVAPASVKEDTSIGDLGVDSLDALRIIAAIEKKYHIEIPEEQINGVRTMGDIVRLVEAAA